MINTLFDILKMKRKGKYPYLTKEMIDIANDIKEEFDEEYYLSSNLDVLNSRINPLDHYVKYGWMEGRNPNIWFSTSTYLHLHSDVRAAGVNAFWHYVVAGRAEGRATAIEKVPLHQAVLSTTSIRQREAGLDACDQACLNIAELAVALKGLADSRLLVSVSHDDYTRNVGGVQNCIMIEARAAAQAGVDYLHLYSKTNRTWLAPAGAELTLGVTLNGLEVGAFNAADFLIEFAKLRSTSSQLVIHSLLGHDPDWVTALARLCTRTAPIFWTHDHSAICPSYTLQRNDITSCNGPALSSKQCSLCAYGEERRGGHVDRIEALLRQVNPIIVSPSEFSRQHFQDRVASNVSPIVVEHCVLTNKRKVNAAKNGAIRVAFVGNPARHKGWSLFVDLVSRFGQTGEYEFIVFGPQSTELSGSIKHHAVTVTTQGRTAMVDAVRGEDVDFVFLWPTWQETFCIAAHEAVAAGAKLLTNPASGNVAQLVASQDCGTIFDNFADVFAAFEDGSITNLASQRRSCVWRFDLEFSRMSFNVMQDEAVAA